MPACSDDGSPAVLLDRRGQSVAETALVVLRDGAFWLIDGSGDVLASASDLPSLLDALDGGVSEPQRRHEVRAAPSAAVPIMLAA